MIKIRYLLNRLTLVFLFLLAACTPTGNIVRTAIVEEGSIESITFCPRDNCEKVLADFILSAESSVHCAFYDLNLPSVISALKNQSKEIDVKLILDNKSTSRQMHNKFCIVDKQRISTGSFNPTENGAYKNNNNVIIINSRTIARNYEDEFLEIGNKERNRKTAMPVIYLNNTRIQNYFCPEDKCGDKIEKELEKAQTSIHFLQFSFTHNAIANKIIKKLHQGVEVKGVFEKRNAANKYSKYKLLEFQEANIKKDTNPANMHHKLFIIDNKTVILGSFNPSKTADTRNDENIVIIQDKIIAAKFLKEFDFIWNNND